MTISYLSWILRIHYFTCLYISKFNFCLKLYNSLHTKWILNFSNYLTANSIPVVILSILSIIFCVLALFVLVYYIRRRYKLYKEINRIPQELLIKESYRNHLKNLKLKCIINNFVIIILVIEFLQVFGQIFIEFPYLIIYLVNIPGINFPFLPEVLMYSSLYTIPLCYSVAALP